MLLIIVSVFLLSDCTITGPLVDGQSFLWVDSSDGGLGWHSFEGVNFEQVNNSEAMVIVMTGTGSSVHLTDCVAEGYIRLVSVVDAQLSRVFLVDCVLHRGYGMSYKKCCGIKY